MYMDNNKYDSSDESINSHNSNDSITLTDAIEKIAVDFLNNLYKNKENMVHITIKMYIYLCNHVKKQLEHVYEEITKNLTNYSEITNPNIYVPNKSIKNYWTFDKEDNLLDCIHKLASSSVEVSGINVMPICSIPNTNLQIVKHSFSNKIINESIFEYATYKFDDGICDIRDYMKKNIDDLIEEHKIQYGIEAD